MNNWTFRLRDIVIALLMFLVLGPFILLIILMLWLTQGKVFFLQQRPGKNEEPFTLVKFSTMYDAKPGEPEYEHQKERLTPIGKYLRRYSIDEIPQLWNVIKGEMSLVGPRPLLTEYLPLYTQEERKRHHVLPGITGWAQVNGRNTISFKDRFVYDVYYIDHKSHMFDMKIMMLTLFLAMKGNGVYSDDHNTSPLYDGKN